MDGDPALENELDAFSLILPLPYRVALIVVLAVWAWGANLQFLSALKIDVPALVHYPGRHTPTEPTHHLSTYRLATILTIPLTVSILLFWAVCRGDKESAIQWEILPNLYLLALVVIFFLPLQFFSRSGRYRTLTILKRVSIGGLAQPQDGKFGDVLMADVLTSYAKVLGDLFVALCMFFTPGRSSTGRPDRHCGGTYVVPCIIAIPSLIRLRQCLIEYFRVRNANAKAGGIGSHGWGGQHLANALKYSSAFPVVILSALQRDFDHAKSYISETTLFRLWLIAVFVNSFYSFYWDVAKDWDLTLFSSKRERDDPEHPWGLRKHRYFRVHEIYYAVIVMDLMLRCTWSFKLSPHLDHLNDLEGGIFLMELLEVFRRWVWIFFRVETEWVRNHRGPAPVDVLLGEFTNKIDED